MFELEDEYWWYAGLRDLVGSYLLEFKDASLLDAGCGTGALLSMLDSSTTAFGVDRAREALAFCKKRGLRRIALALVAQLPFPAERFDCITSMDVLYHKGVDDHLAVLKEYRRVLKRGGKLVLDLPAFEFLRSEHDRAIHTARRYTRKQVGEMLHQTGFQIVKLTYRNSLLFPIVLATRWLRSKKSESEIPRSDLTKLPDSVNRLLTRILKIENSIVRKINFPIGSSVFCVGLKPPR
jgi:ubiquinone/menaquinone biosynthesis C-methylase UbiE